MITRSLYWVSPAVPFVPMPKVGELRYPGGTALVTESDGVAQANIRPEFYGTARVVIVGLHENAIVTLTVGKDVIAEKTSACLFSPVALPITFMCEVAEDVKIALFTRPISMHKASAQLVLTLPEEPRRSASQVPLMVCSHDVWKHNAVFAYCAACGKIR